MAFPKANLFSHFLLPYKLNLPSLQKRAFLKLTLFLTTIPQCTHFTYSLTLNLVITAIPNSFQVNSS